jgi:hypothetical protein
MVWANPFVFACEAPIVTLPMSMPISPLTGVLDTSNLIDAERSCNSRFLWLRKAACNSREAATIAFASALCGGSLFSISLFQDLGASA